MGASHGDGPSHGGGVQWQWQLLRLLTILPPSERSATQRPARRWPNATRGAICVTHTQPRATAMPPHTTTGAISRPPSLMEKGSPDLGSACSFSICGSSVPRPHTHMHARAACCCKGGHDAAT